MSGWGTTRARWLWLALAGYILLLALVVVSQPPDAFWTVDNGNKWLQSVGSSGSGVDLPYPGRDLDPELRFAPIFEPFAHVVEGRLLSQYPPTFALLSRPFLDWGRPGKLLLPVLGMLAAALGAAFLARKLGGSPLSAFLLAGPLGPLSWYATTFWEHTMVAALLVWGWAALSGLRGRNLVVTAVLFAVATMLREETVVFAGVTALVLLVQRSGSMRKAGLILVLLYIGAMIPFALWMWSYSGSPFGLHFQGNLSGVGNLLQGRLAVIDGLLWSGDEGALEVVATVLTVVIALLLLWGRRWASVDRDPALLTAAAAWTMAGVALITVLALSRETDMPQTLIRTGGLLLFAPWSFWALLQERKHPCANVLSAVAVVSLGVFLLVTPPISVFGVHWGPRILVSIVPLLAVLAALGLARVGAVAEAEAAGVGVKLSRSQIRRRLLVGSGLVAMALACAGLQMDGLIQQRRVLVGVQDLIDQTRAQIGEPAGPGNRLEPENGIGQENRLGTGKGQASGPGRPIVTHMWWYAQIMAPIYAHRPIYRVRSTTEFREWVRRFAETGGDTFFWAAAPPHDALPPGLAVEVMDGQDRDAYPPVFRHRLLTVKVGGGARP